MLEYVSERLNLLQGFLYRQHVMNWTIGNMFYLGSPRRAVLPHFSNSNFTLWALIFCVARFKLQFKSWFRTVLIVAVNLIKLKFIQRFKQGYYSCSTLGHVTSHGYPCAIFGRALIKFEPTCLAAALEICKCVNLNLQPRTRWITIEPKQK